MYVADRNRSTKLLTVFSAVAGDDGTFNPPTLADFYPEIILFEGTPFALNRIMLIRLLIMVLLIVLFWAWARRFDIARKTQSYVPSRFQLAGEIGLNFVRKNIAHETLGQKDGDRFLPLLTTIFFTTLAMNLTGLVPGLNIAATSVIGLPLVMAVASFAVFIYAGVKLHGLKYFQTALFPPGVPAPMYILVTPIEFLATFILRPVTLTVRLLMNMLVGHLLLVLSFSATHFFFFYTDGLTMLFGAGTLVFGLAFTLFELLVSVLQAYVFTILTTVYIQLSLAEEH